MPGYTYMSPTSTVVTLGIGSLLSFVGYVAIPDAAPAQLNWKDLAGVSSATLMFAALVYVLRFVSTEREAASKERATERQESSKERAALASVNEKVAERFAETTTNLMRDFREDSQVARQALHDALRDAKK